jgi:predicted O-methyltransferase YrrM
MEHFYQTIPNWFDYHSVYRDAVATAHPHSLFVEIGVWKGGSTAFMGVEIVNSGKPITFHAIDTFLGSKEHGNIENFYEEAKQNLSPLLDRGALTLIQGHSHEVVHQYPDESIDFLFIDGSHEYEDVKKDLLLWLPKVKHGGIIAGHDYDPAWLGVVQAVNEVIGKDHIKTINSAFVHTKP